MSMEKNLERIAISKKIRFEVFKRDGFKCQYCGMSAPDVILHVDHIQPISKNGTNELFNLITSCIDCNLGKSNNELSDSTIVKKQIDELQKINERREQIEMIFEWRKSIQDLDIETVLKIVDYIEKKFPISGFTIKPEFYKTIKSWLNNNTLTDILDSIDTSFNTYCKEPTKENIENSLIKIQGIINIKKVIHVKPYLKEIYYIRKVMQNRFSYVPKDIVTKLEKAYLDGISLDDLLHYSKTLKNWTTFRIEVLEK